MLNKAKRSYEELENAFVELRRRYLGWDDYDEDYQQYSAKMAGLPCPRKNNLTVYSKRPSTDMPKKK